MNIPLSKEESAFAEEHHNLIYAFLNKKKYHENGFYDIVVFGYLRAVRSWLEREDLREKYEFSTIAFQCMRSSVSNHFRAQKRAMRRADTRPYNEDTDAPYYIDSVWDNVSRNFAAQAARDRLPELLTPRQSKVVYLKSYGYNNREISRECGLKLSRVERELRSAGDAVKNYAPELLELIPA